MIKLKYFRLQLNKKTANDKTVQIYIIIYNIKISFQTISNFTIQVYNHNP